MYDDDCTYVTSSTNHTGHARDVYNIGGDSGDVLDPTNAIGVPGADYADFTGGNQFLIVELENTVPAGGTITLHLGADNPWNNMGVHGSNSDGSVLDLYYGTLSISGTGATTYDLIANSDISYLRIVDYSGGLRFFGLSYAYTDYVYGDCTGSGLPVSNTDGMDYPDYIDLDSDDDGCYDTQEEAVPDPDNDGIVGTGVPTVTPYGLVTSITYVLPVNNIWQNPLIGPCLTEICDNGIDDDGDGMTDSADSECPNCKVTDITPPLIDTSPNDTLVDCNRLTPPATLSAVDDCDTSVVVQYNEVIIHHPTANWKNTTTCSLLHLVSAASHNDQGTPSDSSDDEMTFTITVIGRVTGMGWSSIINGTSISGAYNTILHFGPLLSNGSVLNFTIRDDADNSCARDIRIDMVDF